MKVKYVRISSETQNNERQRQNETKFDRVYLETSSGAIKFCERKEGLKLYRDIVSGLITELHVSSVDRLGRNIIDILTVVEFLHEHSITLFVENIGMYSLIENKENPAFKMIVSVLGNVAEMERTHIRERQRQGIEIAKMKGVYKGRLYGTLMTDSELLEKYKVVVKELKEGQSLRRAARLGGCSLGTAQKVNAVIKKATPLE